MKPYYDYNDRRLMQLTASNDLVAFEFVFRRYIDTLYRSVRINTGSDTDCEKIIQKIFELVWMRKERLASGLVLNAFLHQLTSSKIARYRLDHPEISGPDSNMVSESDLEKYLNNQLSFEERMRVESWIFRWDGMSHAMNAFPQSYHDKLFTKIRERLKLHSKENRRPFTDWMRSIALFFHGKK